VGILVYVYGDDVVCVCGDTGVYTYDVLVYTRTYALRVVYAGIDVRARTLVSQTRLSHWPLHIHMHMHLAYTHTHACFSGGDASRALSDTREAQSGAQVHR
jgi:hypothetical protein